MSEQKIQAAIMKYILAKGGYPVKVIAATKAGIPDIVACYKSKFVAFEIKAETGTASPLQIANIHNIKLAGGYAAVIRSTEEAKELLDIIDDIEGDTNGT